METIFSLPGRALARALRTTVDSGPLHRIYYTQISGRPAILSSDAHHMTITLLPGDPPARTFGFNLAPSMTKSLVNKGGVTCSLKITKDSLVWEVTSSKSMTRHLADYTTTHEVLERENSDMPDFKAIISLAMREQRPATEYQMSVKTARLIADMNLGAARIYGSSRVIYPYAILFENDQDVTLLAMSAEWTHLGEGAPETPGTWSIP